MCNPIELTGTIKQFTAADELKKISDRVNSLTKAELQYERTLKEAREAAEAGETSIGLKIMKENFFLENMAPESVPKLMTKEEYAHKVYLEQEAMLDLFRKNGFTVTVKAPEVPNLFSLDMNPEMQARLEMQSSMTRRFVESDVTISWA